MLYGIETVKGSHFRRVALDNPARRGLLGGLYDFQKKDLAGRFELGVALVSHSNPHSMQAHVEGLGMTKTGEFELNGSLFAILAFRI